MRRMHKNYTIKMPPYNIPDKIKPFLPGNPQKHKFASVELKKVNLHPHGGCGFLLFIVRKVYLFYLRSRIKLLIYVFNERRLSRIVFPANYYLFQLSPSPFLFALCVQQTPQSQGRL